VTHARPDTLTRTPFRRGIPRLRPGSIALLSYGFRPFFLGAALWACAAMVLWIEHLSGHVALPTAYGAVAWHAHELLFGYVGAVLTGFLLTAIPNWTGRMPLQGLPLLGLFLLWAAGRAAMLLSDRIGLAAAITVDGVYLFALTAVIVREILAGRNWRNLKIAVLVTLLATANLLFHAEALRFEAADYGIRLACTIIILLITLVGGRIIPSFTHNWLVRQGSKTLPAPLDRFDMAAVAVAGVALAGWIAAPAWWGTGVLLLVAALVHGARLRRWAGGRTWREPLVFILHVGYAFVPLGAATLGASILWPKLLPPSAALHAWTTGAIGIMTLAVMTRATLGHTGRTLVSTPATTLIYAAVLAAALARVAAGLMPNWSLTMLMVASHGWMLAFGLFALVYGPMLLRPRQPA
jgi:uncharacterized protein involved in response to NO